MDTNKGETDMNSIQALELAYGKGNLKKWALEAILIDMLYNTEPRHCSYVKLKSLDGMTFDSETDDEHIVRFGYLWQIPRTEIDLHIVKKTGLLYLTKEGIGFGYDGVEKAVLEYLFQQKAKGNLYLQTNLNDIEFQIK